MRRLVRPVPLLVTEGEMLPMHNVKARGETRYIGLDMMQTR